MDVPEVEVSGLPAWVTRWKLSVEDYYRMAEVGILGERDRVELIEGEIVAMTPIGDHHSGKVNRINEALSLLAAGRAMVSVQNPVQLDNCTVPQPDFLLLKPRPDYYETARPRTVDVLLVIEVADTSLRYNRTVKHLLYARYGVPEYRIVDLKAGLVEVSRNPVGDSYTDVSLVGRDGVLEPIGLPGTAIPASRISG